MSGGTDGPALTKAAVYARTALEDACRIIELGDERLLATDGPAGGQPPELSLAEWRALYVTLDKARKRLWSVAEITAQGAVPSPDGPALLCQMFQPPQSEADLRKRLADYRELLTTGVRGLEDDQAADTIIRATESLIAWLMVSARRGSPDGGDLPALLESVLREGAARQIVGPQVLDYKRAAAWMAERLAARGVGALPAPREDEVRLNRLEVRLESALTRRAWPDTLADVHAALELLRGASRSGGGSAPEGKSE